MSSSAAVAAGQLLVLRRWCSGGIAVAGSAMGPGGKGGLLLVRSCSGSCILLDGECSGSGSSGWLLLLWRGGSHRGASTGRGSLAPVVANWWLSRGGSFDGATGGSPRMTASDDSTWLLCRSRPSVDRRLVFVVGSSGLLLRGGTSCRSMIGRRNRNRVGLPGGGGGEG